MTRTFDEIMKTALDTCIKISTQSNEQNLYELVVVECMDIAGCDSGTLYLCRDDGLEFVNTKVLSCNINKGKNGKKIDMPHIPYYTDGEVKNVAAHSALFGRTINIEDVYDDARYKYGPGRYDDYMDYHSKSMLVIPLKDTENDVTGVLQLVNCLDEAGNIIPFSAECEKIVEVIARHAAAVLCNLHYVEEIKLSMWSFVQAMSTVIDERTPYNGEHTRKVARYSKRIAERVNVHYYNGDTKEYFDQVRMKNLVFAAMLHDIGKMVVPLSVMNKSTKLGEKLKDIRNRYEQIRLNLKIDLLENRIENDEYKSKLDYLNEAENYIKDINKRVEYIDNTGDKIEEIGSLCYVTENGISIPYLTQDEKECLKIKKGTLTNKERNIMQSHVEMTEKILDNVHFDKSMALVPKWASAHHEMLDGSGYPKHLKGDEICFESRILAVVDIYDALTSADRPYKQPMPVADAFSILDNMVDSGKLDVTIVTYLKEVVNEGSRYVNGGNIQDII